MQIWKTQVEAEYILQYILAIFKMKMNFKKKKTA